MVEANDDSGAPWDDTLREQDWESLGPVFDDRLDHGHGALEWDTHRDVSDTHDVSSSVSGDSEITSAPPSHNMQIDLNACAQQASKVSQSLVASHSLVCSLLLHAVRIKTCC